MSNEKPAKLAQPSLAKEQSQRAGKLDIKKDKKAAKTAKMARAVSGRASARCN